LISITEEFNSEDWGWRELKREVDSLVLFKSVVNDIKMEKTFSSEQRCFVLKRQTCSSEPLGVEVAEVKGLTA
jgi:hypothetical protein